MGFSAITAHEYTMKLSSKDVNGPLDLKETILSAQTSEPEWLREGTSFTDVELIGDLPVKYTLTQTGNVNDFTIEVRATGGGFNEGLVNELKSHLDRVLGLRDEILSFYDRFSDPDEPLSSTFPELRGLRLMRGTSLYESLICSILSQNNSARLWNRTARLLMSNFGRRVVFPDGTGHFLFPKPEDLARLSAGELRKVTSMGYRAKPVVQVSRMIVRGLLKLEDLANCSYEEALETLLGLPGVGPKVADCFLLYGMGRLEAAPVDVWMHRIVSKLYFNRKRVSKFKTTRFLRERFGEWAGYAQLYLFDFARRTASKEKRADRQALG